MVERGLLGEAKDADGPNRPPATWPYRVRDGRAIVRPVSQITLKLKPTVGKVRFDEVVAECLRWLARRAGRTLPEVAWAQGSFELTDIGAQRVGAVSLSEPRYWAARLDDACKEVPLRTWVTEIGVGLAADGDVLFGARLISATRGEDVPYRRTLPAFVRRILDSGEAELDGVPVTGQPLIVSTRMEVDDLVHLLESRERQSDVVVVALPEGSVNLRDASVDVQLLARELRGVSHVYVLTGAASFELTDLVGRVLSVFRGAVRVYRPGFQGWIDQPTNHPLVLPQRIASWTGGDASNFLDWLVDHILARTVQGLGREARLPAYNTVRQMAAQADRAALKSHGGTDKELVKLFEQDNDQLRKELREQKEQYDGLLQTADYEREDAESRAATARAQSLEWLYRIRQLEGELRELGAKRHTPIPNTLDGFEDWCKEQLVGAVEVVNRAVQAVRKSDFHDPEFIYKCLVLLRDAYVPMRVEGSKERREAYERALQDLQLEESPTGDGIKYAADQYSVVYGGARRPLDRHLKGSNSRDRRYGFRLYFFWDEEGEVVVVGWLPSHLDNRLT